LLALLYIPWLYSGNWLFFVTSPDPATSILLSIPCYKNPKEENKMLKYSVSALSQNLGNLKRNAVFITGLIALLISGAFAQEQRSEISIQGTGFYTKDATGNAVRQRATDTGGFLVGYRYRFNRWLSAEANYGFDRNTQQFFVPAGFASIRSDVHQTTGSLLVNLPHPARLRLDPYVLAGAGALTFNPGGNTLIAGADTQTRAAFVYGGGADFPLTHHFSLRAEYRGLVYKTPDFGLRALNTDTLTHTAQPSAGIVFRF